MDKAFITINKFAEMTGCGQTYIRNRCKEGTLPCIMSGNKYLILADEALEILKKEAVGDSD